MYVFSYGHSPPHLGNTTYPPKTVIKLFLAKIFKCAMVQNRDTNLMHSSGYIYSDTEHWYPAKVSF